MDTKKLRQKILDLAIRGKLVPQDPNDEPASILLERIKAEKEKMIQEGKIKRPRKSSTSDTPHYTHEDAPFEIPSSWAWVKIGEIFYLQAGKNISSSCISDTQTEESLFPCYGGNGLRGYVRNYNKEGDFPLIGRQGALCGNINVAHGRFYATEHAVVVETFAQTNIHLCVSFLTHLNLNQYATATAQPGLSVKTINEVLIPLPPIEEQKRIVKEVEKWFKLIDTIEQNQTDLKTAIEQTKSKVLDLAIHGKLVPQDPNDEPASELLKRINPNAEITCDNGHSRKCQKYWYNCKIEDVFTVTMGQSPKGESINTSCVGIEFHQGKIQFTDKWLGISNFYTSDPKKLANPNALLLCVRAPVGVLNITDRIVCIGRGLCSLKPCPALDLNYAYHALTTYKEIFENKATGTTFKAISGDTIKNEFFPLPPLAEQKRIVQKIEDIFTKLDHIKESLEA